MCKNSDIEEFSHLIHYVLSKKLNIHQGHTNYEDYVQEGRIALMLAVNAYKDDKDSEFITYAIMKIRYGIMKYINKDASIRTPSYIINNKIKGARKLKSNQKDSLTENERKAVNIANDIMYFEDMVNESYMPDSICYKDEHDDLNEAILLSTLQQVALSQFKENNQLIIIDWLKMTACDSVSVKSLANKHNVSSARVTQIITKYKDIAKNKLVKEGYLV